MSKKIRGILVEVFACLLSVVIFWIPFYFVIINSAKDKAGAAKMNLTFPEPIVAADNYARVIAEQNYMVIRGFINSVLITFFSILLLILISSMAGFVMQRRSGKGMAIANFIVLAGLMIPPAIVPTIWVLNGVGLYKTMPGMILVEVALSIPFSTMLYRGFMGTIPKEIDEAAIVDGCNLIQLFIKIIAPLLKPVTATVTVLSAINIFNDFVNPLYFFPGAKNVTVQLTMYNFLGRYGSNWQLLFANVILISIPPLILFIFFSKKIISGMVSGAVKG